MSDFDDDYDKVEQLCNHLIDKQVDEVYIDENDAFVIIFKDNTLLELSADEGLSMYWEYPTSLH